MNNANLIERLRAALVVKFENQIDQLEAEVLSEVLARRGYPDLVPSTQDNTAFPASEEFDEPVLVIQTSDEVKPPQTKVAYTLSCEGATTGVAPSDSASMVSTLAVEAGSRLRRKSGRHAEILVTKVADDGIWLDRQVRWPGVTRRTRINSHEISAFLRDYEVVAGGAN